MTPSPLSHSRSTSPEPEEHDATRADSEAILPDAKPFDRAQKTYLSTFLDRYFAINDPLKGAKKRWVEDHVLESYCQHFQVEGEKAVNLSDLLTKMARWFSNQENKNAKGKRVVTQNLPKKPRAVNALSLFADRERDRVRAGMKAIREERGLDPKDANLSLHREVTNSLYAELSTEDKEKYETEASEYNEKIKQAPSPEDVYVNQDDIVQHVVSSLESLCGYNWGQCSDVAFFVQGAYRDRNGKLKTMNATISPVPKVGNFTAEIPNYDSDLRKRFKQWALKAVPVSKQATHAEKKDVTPDAVSPAITFGDDGTPSLPEIDIHSLSPKVVSTLLEKYIIALWNCALHGDRELDWGFFDKYRSLFFRNAHELSALQTIIPRNMNPGQLYDLYGKFFDGQIHMATDSVQFAVDQESLHKTLGLPLAAEKEADTSRELEDAIEEVVDPSPSVAPDTVYNESLNPGPSGDPTEGLGEGDGKRKYDDLVAGDKSGDKIANAQKGGPDTTEEVAENGKKRRKRGVPKTGDAVVERRSSRLAPSSVQVPVPEQTVGASSSTRKGRSGGASGGKVANSGKAGRASAKTKK